MTPQLLLLLLWDRGNVPKIILYKLPVFHTSIARVAGCGCPHEEYWSATPLRISWYRGQHGNTKAFSV